MIAQKVRPTRRQVWRGVWQTLCWASLYVLVLRLTWRLSSTAPLLASLLLWFAFCCSRRLLEEAKETE